MKLSKDLEVRYLTLTYYCDIRYTPSGKAVCCIYAVNDSTQYRIWKDEANQFGSLPDIAPGEKIKVYGKECERTIELRGTRKTATIKEFNIFRWERIQ